MELSERENQGLLLLSSLRKLSTQGKANTQELEPHCLLEHFQADLLESHLKFVGELPHMTGW